MIVERAPAKINLALHVRARRPDGYHELETLFAFLADGDTISLERAAAPSFRLTGPFGSALAAERDNLVQRAVDAFAGAFGDPGPLAITLDKQLPIASGIGGGSADAAATLRALARLMGVAVDERLYAIAEGLGADVPACLLGKSAIGLGKGEQLAPLAGLADTPVLLVNPGVPVSTGAVFKAWDGQDLGPLPTAGTLLDRARNARNDLEPPALALAPEIADVLAALGAAPGVLLSRMSGSGATCFALFSNREAQAMAAATIAAGHPGWWTFQSSMA
ncbi:MAG: 4-(cytidine 5'-diphospho)-2-C-methyl-D-erythritol kinase [Sphingomonas sp.]